MKILRFGISDDTHGNVPDEQRSWRLAQESLSDSTALDWETVMEPVWPSSSLASEVERAIEREQPDLVFIACASYWVSYPSAPLGVHRSNLPFAKHVARAGFWAASKPLIADRELFHQARALVVGRAVRAFFFQPEKALASVEAAFRAALRHEHLALAVRGPLPLNIPGRAAFRAECEARRAAFDSSLEALCRSLHIAYHGYTAADAHPRSELQGDRIHVNAAGHARRGETEAGIMLRAWQALASGDQ